MNGWKEVVATSITGPGIKAYKKGGLTAMVGLEKDGLWHLSLSAHKRNPSYMEIKMARYELMPHDIDVAMIFPATKDFANIDPHCFHLFQLAAHEYPPMQTLEAPHV